MPTPVPNIAAQFDGETAPDDADDRFMNWPMLLLVKPTLGPRPSAEDEETGLDVVDHGERAYHLAEG